LFHQFSNIFFKAVIVFLLIIAGVETNPGPNPPTGGRVILYVKDNIYVSRRDDLDFDDLEGIWVQIKRNGKQILFAIFISPLKVPKIYGGNWNPQ
jgi:hypothetical protein